MYGNNVEFTVFAHLGKRPAKAILECVDGGLIKRRMKRQLDIIWNFTASQLAIGHEWCHRKLCADDGVEQHGPGEKHGQNDDCDMCGFFRHG